MLQMPLDSANITVNNLLRPKEEIFLWTQKSECENVCQFDMLFQFNKMLFGLIFIHKLITFDLILFDFPSVFTTYSSSSFLPLNLFSAICYFSPTTHSPHF